MERETEPHALTLTVYCADQCGNPKNCLYPRSGTSNDPDELKRLFRNDHTLIRFKNNYRCIDNFAEAVVAVLDNDNDHSDNPQDWVSIENISTIFPDVPCVVSTSRNHMRQKGARSPRPRYHVAFPIDPITRPEAYTALMQRVQAMFPFFDGKALDAGRFFFGNPDTEVYSFPGRITLTQFMEEQEAERAFAEIGVTIQEGSRNSTLSHGAGKLLKRWGDIPEAYQGFLAQAEQCNPPLEQQELAQIWHSARKFFHTKVKHDPAYVKPGDYNAPSQPTWEKPIPFTQHTLPPFPVDALPTAIREYVLAVAESTQTPVDMSASAALAVLALCQQGKYRIAGKEDWREPLNLFVVIVAEPSERKSAVINFMTRPVNLYEAEYNQQHAGALERSRMEKRILEKQQRALEDQVLKGKAHMEDLQDIALQVANFKELSPLRLYVDDVTTEKLTSILSDNGGTAAVVSAEGGIFDMLSGIYTKNVNIDVMLKGHSGDCIRVDRIGRNSESIMNPALTVLLAVQPSVLSGMMQNGTFRGRGLTARFMYCMPTSIIGQRKYRTEAIPAEVSHNYDALIRNLLQEEMPKAPELIYLSPEADQLLEQFSCEVEGKLKTEYSDIPDWAGKLVGAVLRIAGLLCRASVTRCDEFLEVPPPLIVDQATMEGAIAIGRYFTEHSRAAFSLMGADNLVKQSQYMLDAIVKNRLTEFTRRDIMRMCRSFKTADEVQPVLNHLADLGYVAPKATDLTQGKGRPANQSYMVNPLLYENAS